MNFELQESDERLRRYAIRKIFGPKFQSILANFGPNRKIDHDVAQLEAKSVHMNLELQELVKRLQRYVFWPILGQIRAK